MKRLLAGWGAAGLVLAGLVAGCGGGGDNGAPAPAPSVPVVAANGSIGAASLLAANDTAINPAGAFAVVLDAGITPVTVSGPPKVNFVVFSDGKIKADLKITDLSLAIAKLVPGTNSDPDRWVSYIYRKETAAPGVGPGNPAAPVLVSAMQATTDGKQTDAGLLAAQLVYHADGYYTYSFKTDIKNIVQTNGVVFEPSLTHRVAIQLSYKNAAGGTVLVNPYFDFTLDGSGKSVAVTDPAKTRKMTDVASCNGCHQRLALHGGGRVDTQYCVMCHNPGTTDANSGNVLNFSSMVHKIHAGKLLKSKLDAGQGGEDYTIWGYQNRKYSYADVGFPQDLRNCTVCHSGSNPKTPQGDNWKAKPSKEACLTCHANLPGSSWEALHKVVAVVRYGAAAQATTLQNADCADCHKAGSTIATDRVHFNQVEANAAKYKINIESVAFNDTADHKARSVTVKYFVSDPTHGDAAYKLVTADCSSVSVPTCANTTKFGNLRFYLAYQNMVGQLDAVTEFSAYNNGGGSAYAYAYKGTNDGSNHYTVSIPVPDDTATAVAKGTARVVSTGQVKEPKLSATASTDPRPEVVPGVLVNTLVQHTSHELALSGALQPRRVIVATEKCNACHGTLGAATGSNTVANAFHNGGRTTVEACVLCHDANRMSSTIMTNGMALNESYQFKRMIHGIHGNARRASPFTQGNTVVDLFNMDGTSATGGLALWQQLDSAGNLIVVDNYAAEVAYPDATLNCNACHVNNSYKTDMGPLGSVVKKPIDPVSGVATTDPNAWLVISPKAATCTSCHDGRTASGQSVINHVIQFGGATFGDKSQRDVALLPRETCDDCHTNGGAKNVDIVHGQK